VTDGRLHRRLERERAARLEAEAIAERGLRDLWEANALLDRRVEERTAELELALAAATAARDAATGVFARLAHQLTTPLHAIGALLELVDAGPLDPESRDSIAMARLAARRFEVNLVVVLELAGAGPLGAPVEQRSPADVADEVATRWTWAASRRSVLLLTDAPTEAAAGRWRVVSCLADLLVEAALRHSGPGTVTLGLMPSGGGIALRVDAPVDRETFELAVSLVEAYGGSESDGSLVVR
jgi:two-component system, sensor histidine kinase